MAIFVTGGAGYIGSHTVIELIKSGYDVVVADNFSNSKREAVKRVKELAGKDFSLYEIDVCNGKALDKIFTIHDIECVIHFAGLKAVGESVKKPLEYYKNNLNSTIALSNTMIRHGVNKIIFSSSATVYCPDNKMPLTEDSLTGGCTNPYGWTKYMCEQILTDVVNAGSGFTAVMLRYFNPIGAHESGKIGEDPQDIPNNIMPYIAQTAVGRREFLKIFGDDYDTADGTGVRDYLHVVDLAEGHVAAVKYAAQSSGGVDIINLGTGNGVSVLELVTAFEDATGVKIPREVVSRRPGDIAICYAATDKAKNLLGWETKKTLKEACADTWRWQKNNPGGYGL
ncbi:MAG: UDP-glucose 4-epimerase GalE [Oscillospiraceae bacterium]|nr:UDP-glucose 4-epimerase GalE [Oscillospiraceae bacterium]MCL2279098.1 UDP-glucose 4-epimerase GalE [Oscillospiraceae bacterium]